MDNATFYPGDIKFVDINNDGKIDEDDKVEIGKPLPDLTMGLNLTFSYKKFDFGAYAFASLGNDIVRSSERNQQLTNRTRYFLNVGPVQEVLISTQELLLTQIQIICSQIFMLKMGLI